MAGRQGNSRPAERPAVDTRMSPEQPLAEEQPAHSDIPSVDDVPSADVPSGQEAVASAEPVADQQRLVRVTTPLMELWIDRLGGDVVGLELRDHLETLADEGEEGLPGAALGPQ